ncbi:MAG: class I SAM-dependent methyltransferase [Actinomadura sp.]
MRALSARRLALLAGVGSVAALATTVTLGVLGALGRVAAIQLAVAVAAFGVLAFVLVGLHLIVQRLAVLSRRLAKAEERMTSALSTLTDDVRPRLDTMSREITAASAGLEKSYEQLEAYVDLRSLIQPRAPLPALRGWAASPDVLRLLAETMWRRRPGLIVECGSGSSSVWLGYLAEQIKPAKVVCLEHDEHYARMSRDLIRAHHLDDVVEVRLAPLADWTYGTQTYSWYDTAALEDLADIGLLFVDGPPGTTGPEARFPAVPLLYPRCSADVVVVLDDSDRDEETAISDRWLEEHPELERVVLRFDKGAHVLTRRVT